VRARASQNDTTSLLAETAGRQPPNDTTSLLRNQQGTPESKITPMNTQLTEPPANGQNTKSHKITKKTTSYPHFSQTSQHHNNTTTQQHHNITKTRKNPKKPTSYPRPPRTIFGTIFLRFFSIFFDFFTFP
jgi:hypothetical protein